MLSNFPELPVQSSLEAEAKTTGARGACMTLIGDTSSVRDDAIGLCLGLAEELMSWARSKMAVLLSLQW